MVASPYQAYENVVGPAIGHKKRPHTRPFLHLTVSDYA